MKVTVCFGKTGIVVPCKDGQIRVRELTQQALQRFLRTKEKDPSYWVNIHHLEYTDGGILDPDDMLADVVEDKDKLIAVYDEQDQHPKPDDVNGSLTDRNSPDAFETEVATQLAAFQPIGGEIEVTPSALKLGTPLLVRRSSDPAVGLPSDFPPGASHVNDHALKTSMLDVPSPPKENNALEAEVMSCGV
ncbi:PREDICTED: partitioning defective 3 homolog B-like [Gekko japonicus]|uniref:Partitioning defective 3 homolog B-like n=1 Tax=Gekko japonicus TaxID=146911 RepID=A0ABM1K8I8_GEKJA|nr:PREDICTED: partitioning defective 3 homolog B-like [Gekko japonicus]